MTNTSTFQRLLAVTALLGLAGLASACGDDETSLTACGSDADCSFGTVCTDSGACSALSCTTNGDCLNGDQACVDNSGAMVCSAVECGCINCDQCPVGEQCVNGSCGVSNPNTCSGPNDCDPNEVCDANQCRPCQGDECPITTTDCNTDGCETGFTCNAATGVCDPDNVVTAGACGTCVTVDECGGDPWKCAPLPTGSACLPACTTVDDCDTGWICQSGNCVPESFRCSGCVVDGCSAAQACNPGSGQCQAATATCESCGNDWECGPGNACDAGSCVPRCNAGTCASGGACRNTLSGISVCEESCQAVCAPACSGATPYCVEGRCAECRDDGDCDANESCDSVNGLCGGGEGCAAPTPYFWNGGCVACITNDHCGALFCNTSSNTCVSDTCASCADPYPACTQVGEDFYCVQCDDDGDCGAGGTCNTSTFACEGGSVSPTAANCATDADCDSGSQTGFVNKCDPSANGGEGLCWDTGGSCDNITAYCISSSGGVNDCISILDIFTGGIPGGFPIPGGSTLPGNCECDAPGAACKVGTCQDAGFLTCLLNSGDFLTCLTAVTGPLVCSSVSL